MSFRRLPAWCCLGLAVAGLLSCASTQQPNSVTSDAKSTGSSSLSHRVAQGETLTAIAGVYGVAVQDIVRVNSLEDPNRLTIGQVLQIPGPTYADSRGPELKASTEHSSAGSTTGPTELRKPTQSGARPLPATDGGTSVEDVHGDGESVNATLRCSPTSVPVTGEKNLLWPVSGGVILEMFRSRSGAVLEGLSIAAPLGTPVFASGSGKVLYAGHESANLGKVVIIEHSPSFSTVYGQLAELNVLVGDSVCAGQQVGSVGQVAAAESPQIFYQVRVDRVARDPLDFVSRR